MNNFWAWVALFVFGPMVLVPLVYAVILFFDVLSGGATCHPITCR